MQPFTESQLEELFHRGESAAAQSRHSDAVAAYEHALEGSRRANVPDDPASRRQAQRSIAFNLAQQLNRIGNFQRALEVVDFGMTLAPTGFGSAVALAARGEAQYALGRQAESMQSYERAVAAHPIVGRLNSADAMSREPSGALLGIAEAWTREAVELGGAELPAELLTEVEVILRRVATRRAR